MTQPTGKYFLLRHRPRSQITTHHSTQRFKLTLTAGYYSFDGTVGTDPPLYPGRRRVRNRVVPVPRRRLQIVYHFRDLVLALLDERIGISTKFSRHWPTAGSREASADRVAFLLDDPTQRTRLFQNDGAPSANPIGRAAAWRRANQLSHRRPPPISCPRAPAYDLIKPGHLAWSKADDLNPGRRRSPFCSNRRNSKGR